MNCGVYKSRLTRGSGLGAIKILIGITGGIGSGKSTVSRLFEKNGAAVIDADKISREVIKRGEAAYYEVIEYFTDAVVAPNGEIDRKKLAGIVFSDKNKLAELNRITHKHIFRAMKERIADASDKDLIVLDVPLLFSADFPFKCDKTIAVVADRKLRVKRVMQRDNCSSEEVERRMRAQLSDDELCRLADEVLYNNGSESEVEDYIKKFIAENCKQE